MDGVGYKRFVRGKDGKLGGWFVRDRVHEGRWQTASSGKIQYTDSSHSYPAGFHVWLEVPQHLPTSNRGREGRVEMWKVQYQGVITSGIDKGQHVVVAKRMKLIERVGDEGRRVTVEKG